MKLCLHLHVQYYFVLEISIYCDTNIIDTGYNNDNDPFYS